MRLCAENRVGARRSHGASVVYRCAGQSEEFCHQSKRTRKCTQRWNDLDGSSIDGFSRVQESDVLAIPDPDTFQILPFGDKDAAEARVFCDIHHLDGSAFTGDPRQVLRRHVEAARGEGLTFYIAPDIEFFYFTPPQPGERPTPLDFGGYFDLTTRDVTGDLRKQTIRTLEQIGIPVEYSFHEDSPSQQEIDLRHDDALTIADSVMTFRHVVREVAAAHGVYATFMPKPLEGVQGSGMHTHLSLFTGDENAFYDEADEYNLSPSQNHLWPVSYNTLQKLQPSQIRQ